MSLINPESRWWNRDSTRRCAAYLLWTTSIALALIGAWSMMLQDDSPLPEWIGILGAILPIPLLIGGSFLLSFGTVDGFDGRKFVWVMALYFIAIGIGSLVGDAMSEHPVGGSSAVFIVFIVGGVVAVLASEGWRLRSRRIDALRATVHRSGTVTSGVVTRARHYSLNYRPVTRVTAQFSDGEGSTRWSTASVDGTVNKGESVRVQYSQKHLGRRGAVILSKSGHRR